jgi:glycosyltransferase involved in cell wall biosynthesis
VTAPSAGEGRIGVLHTIRSLRVDGVVKVLLRNLHHHDRTRFRHYVCAMRREKALAPQFEELGLEPIFVDHRGPAGVPATVARLRRLIRELDIGVVHANRTLDLALAGPAARSAGVPVVSSIHWLGRPEDHPEDEHLSWARRHGEMMLTVALNRSVADRIIAVSGAVRDSYASLPGFPADRVDVVYPGLDMHVPIPSGDTAAALRRTLGIEGRRPVLLNVGRLHAVKGQEHLIPAMSRIRERLPGAVLLIAGGGELHEELAGRIAAAGLGDAVRLLGMRDDVDALLGISDLLILSSESEAAPLPLFEAMRAGLPVVATAVGGVTEIVDDGITGTIVPRADPAAIAAATVAMFAEPGTAATMGRAAREAGLARYDIRVSVRRIEAIYDSLVALAPVAPGEHERR